MLPIPVRRHCVTGSYEFKALYACAANLRLQHVQQDPASTNAHVESFAIHCRVLISFLFGHDLSLKFQLKKTDVLAIDYFHDDQHRWVKSCPRVDQQLIEARKHADKQIAHITVSRRGLNQNPNNTSHWRISDNLRSLATAMQQFLDQASASRVDSSAAGVMRQLIRVALSATATASPSLCPADASQPSIGSLVSIQACTQSDTCSLQPSVITTERTG